MQWPYAAGGWTTCGACSGCSRDKRDWKYNNDYVDDKDAWRHSKWLSFMERRLRLAKRLLSPKHSVLIVTIDENELNNLALVLAEVFPDATRQMVSSVIIRAACTRMASFRGATNTCSLS